MSKITLYKLNEVEGVVVPTVVVVEKDDVNKTYKVNHALNYCEYVPFARVNRGLYFTTPEKAMTYLIRKYNKHLEHAKQQIKWHESAIKDAKNRIVDLTNKLKELTNER